MVVILGALVVLAATRMTMIGAAISESAISVTDARLIDASL